MFQALARITDVPAALEMLQPRIRSVGRGGALLMFTCCLLAIIPLGYFWYRFDLHSTWDYFDWIADGAPADVQTAAATIAATPETAAAAPDDAALRTILFMLPFAFTLLPSAIQLGLSRFVSVPGIGEMVKLSIALDLVTDWPTMWAIAQANPWFAETFGWAPLAWLVQVAATAIGVVVVSLAVQAAFILVAAVGFYVGLILVFGDGPRQRQVAVVPAER